MGVEMEEISPGDADSYRTALEALEKYLDAASSGGVSTVRRSIVSIFRSAYLEMGREGVLAELAAALKRFEGERSFENLEDLQRACSLAQSIAFGDPESFGEDRMTYLAEAEERVLGYLNTFPQEMLEGGASTTEYTTHWAGQLGLKRRCLELRCAGKEDELENLLLAETLSLQKQPEESPR